MIKTAGTVLTLLVTFTLISSAARAQDQVEVSPALKVSAADFAVLLDNNRILDADQKLVDRVMHKLGLEPFVPAMPTYPPLIANSVLALLNQLDYTEVARKVGAPMPARPGLETGDRMSNNRFLHFYNNQILRSVAMKLELAATPPPADLKTGSFAQQDHRLIEQNEALLAAIAKKLGVPSEAGAAK
jgi:hypothetical protein